MPFSLPKLICVQSRRDRSGIKRELILEILGEGSMTEREILRQIGDNRYSREIVRKLLQDGLVYRVGKVRISICFCFQKNELYFFRVVQKIHSDMLLQTSLMGRARWE
jgi:hypothetical protein